MKWNRMLVCCVLIGFGLTGCAEQSAEDSQQGSDLGMPAPDLLLAPDLMPVDPTVACGVCFPLEALPMSLRMRGEELLLKALDAEALYTIAADIKPMSSGFVSLTYPANQPESTEVGELRQILARFTCTSAISAGVQTFAATYSGERYVEGVFFHRRRFDETVSAYKQLFTEIGAVAGAEPLSVVEKVDADATTRRFAGYGHLFGYPSYAVDFFVSAAEEERKTGKFVERDFIQLPTYISPRGRFVYAVPKGHVENDEDRALRLRTEKVLERYRALRQTYIGPDKPGVLSLVRTWFDDGKGRCAPQHARLL